jgi:hypothetical protein
MGADFSHKVANLVSGLEQSAIAPVEIIAHLPR